MESRLKYLLLKTVQDNGILPITSVCNMACHFCSHHNNPPGLNVYRLGHLDLGLIKELLDYIPATGPLIIGESATRIVEGDPMTHPRFMKIIEMIRGIFPEKEIKITTHGSYLNSKIINFLQEKKAVELNISLNCSCPEERVFLMADKKPDQVFSALEMLAASSIKFSGSIVGVPHLIGWPALDKTIRLLNKYNPETIRVFMPGFTCYSAKILMFDVEKMYKEMTGFIKKYDNLSTPVLLEPPQINNLDCLVKGIIKNSPAEKSGLKKGDIITFVNQKEVFTRVDGFSKILGAVNPQVKYQRDGIMMEAIITKKKGESSGLIVDYDLSLELLGELSRVLLNNKGRKTAIISSVLGKGVLSTFLNYFKNKYSFPEDSGEIDLLVAENRFFAGSIMSAGLLTNRDIISCLKETGKFYHKLILPSIIFDIYGNDLTGKKYKEIEKKFNLEIEII